MSGRAFPRFFGAALAAGALLALPALAADDDLDLVSRATGGAAADDASNFPSISADGGRVAFVSDADNLVAGDDNTLTNVFVRDVGQGSTTFVNRADGIAGAPSGQSAFLGVISGDGNHVAFDGTSTIGAPPADPPTRQILLRNVALGTTTLVSRADGPAGAPADATPFQPSISSDGRVVAFESAANNLSSEDDNAVTNIFARDAVSGTTTLVSRASGPGGAGGAGGSTSPSVSGDGRIVVFLSEANNLSTADADGNRDVFARDLVTNLTVLVSRATGPDGAGAIGDSGTAAVSDDGRHVLFYSTADNLSAEDDNAVSNVYVRDLVANTTTLVSRAGGASGAGGDGDSSWGDISADGRFAVFHSLAKNLSADDGDGTRDVFVRDLVAGTTALVSRAAGPSGAAADGNSVFPVISADGRRVGFVSEADNLSADDLNTVGNIFVRTLPPPGALPGPVSPAPAQGAPVPAAAARAVVRCAGIRATIVGTARRDVIRGTARRDVIASLGGNDSVRGLGGNDLICLGAGNDTGDGGAGADRILGQAGGDRLIGGSGPDRLSGGPGPDRLLGLGGRDSALGGPGRDVCAVESRTAC